MKERLEDFIDWYRSLQSWQKDAISIGSAVLIIVSILAHAFVPAVFFAVVNSILVLMDVGHES